MEGEENELNEFLLQILDKIMQDEFKKHDKIENYIDKMAEKDNNFKCLKASSIFSNLNTDVLQLISLKNNADLQIKYINLIGQFAKLLENFKKEYLE